MAINGAVSANYAGMMGGSGMMGSVNWQSYGTISPGPGTAKSTVAAATVKPLQGAENYEKIRAASTSGTLVTQTINVQSQPPSVYSSGGGVSQLGVRVSGLNINQLVE